jgi:hypothetical protein
MTRLSSSTLAFFALFGTLLLLICFGASGSSIVAHSTPIAAVGLSSGCARVDTSVENLLDQIGATTVTYDIRARSYENGVFPRSVWGRCPDNRRPEPFEARA